MNSEQEAPEAQTHKPRNVEDAPGMHNRKRRFSVHPAPWIVLALSLAASVAGWFIARNNAVLHARRNFDAKAYRIAASLDERLQMYQDILHGAVGLYASSVSVERQEWKAYIESVSIDRRFPGIDGLGFIAYVRRGELSEFLRTTRADKAPDFQVTTSQDAEDFLIIKYLEPQGRHSALLGQDMGLDPPRRAVAEDARDRGEAGITGSLILGGSTNSGFLMMLPVYKNRQPTATTADRRANIAGWVYARFVTEPLMEGILGESSKDVIFKVIDETPGAADALTFQSEPLPAGHDPMFQDEIPFPTGGREWKLVFASTSEFESTISNLAPLVAAGGGCLLSILLFGIVWSQSTMRERALAIASEMTSALRSSNERLEYEKYLLQTLMDNVPDRIYFKDREHRFLRNNRAHLLCFGFEDPAQALGKTDHDFFTEEHARDAQEDEQQILQTGQPITKEEKETWPDGSVTWALSTKMPLRDSAGAIVGTFGISRDITDRKRAEEAMLRAKDAAEDASRTKSQFLASMSHELRTPLNSIIGFSNILLKNKGGTLSATDLNFLDRIQANGKHLLGLINEILDLSKIEAHKLELRMSPVALDALVRDTIAQEEGLVKDRPVQLVADLPDHVAPILTDADKLKQVLINLIGNALKFTERGNVTVRVLTSNADKQPLRLEVSDTGIGIPKDKLKVIFEAFQQAEEGTARKYGGTGLGLTISQALCRLMGYTIEAKSEVGRGSTFSVVLQPLGGAASRIPETAPRGRPVVPAQAASQWRLDPAELKGKMVLVIDDEADSRTLVTHAIEEAGCHVISCDSGELGLVMARRLRPHLITTDLLMPGMDGWQVLRALKAEPELRSIPVIVISVVAGENRGRIFGAVEILQKPVDRQELLAALKRSLLPPSPKVLVVDDDEDSLRLMISCIAERGWETRTARNGQEALDLMQSYSPDVIVLDLLMPVMDGIAFLNKIRTDARYQHLPVLIATAKELTPEEAEFLRQETVAVTKKAGAFEEDLKSLIHKLLTRSSQAGSQPIQGPASTPKAP